MPRLMRKSFLRPRITVSRCTHAIENVHVPLGASFGIVQLNVPRPRLLRVIGASATGRCGAGYVERAARVCSRSDMHRKVLTRDGDVGCQPTAACRLGRSADGCSRDCRGEGQRGRDGKGRDSRPPPGFVNQPWGCATRRRQAGRSHRRMPRPRVSGVVLAVARRHRWSFSSLVWTGRMWSPMPESVPAIEAGGNPPLGEGSYPNARTRQSSSVPRCRMSHPRVTGGDLTGRRGCWRGLLVRPDEPHDRNSRGENCR